MDKENVAEINKIKLDVDAAKEKYRLLVAQVPNIRFSTTF
jgi:hypothetical protein